MLNACAAGIDPAADFFSPFTRFWELMAGAVLAYLSLYPPVLQWTSRRLPPNAFSWLGAAGASYPTANNAKAVCGLLLVVTAVLMIDGSKGFPGWWALLPVAGTYLLIAAGPNTWIGNRLLATRMLVAVGLISYPLYLWHWPLLSFIRIVNGTAPSAAAAAFAILLSFALAWLTYLFVERPLRFGKSAPVKAAALLVAMAAIGSAGYFTYAEGGFAFRNPGAEDLVAAAQDYEHAETDEVALGNPDADRTVLIGDSTMEQYIPRVRKLIAQGTIDPNRNRIIFDVHGGCPPIPDIARDVNPACAPFIDKVLPTLDGDKVKTVALTAWWTPEFTDSEYYLRSDPSKVLLRDSGSGSGSRPR